MTNKVKEFPSSFIPFFESDTTSKMIEKIKVNIRQVCTAIYTYEAMEKYIQALEKANKVDDKDTRELIVAIASDRKYMQHSMTKANAMLEVLASMLDSVIERVEPKSDAGG